jgi:RNA polymerase sigma factor for flagellar operon FliA
VTTLPFQLTESERHRLVEQHTDYARSLAARIRRDISTDVELDELAAYGMRGLVEAANRFDPQRGVAFTTFSYYRIRGAIFDGLRKLGWLNRSEYARFQAASNELLHNAAERSASGSAHGTDEVRAESAANELTSTLDQLAVVFVASLDDSKGAEAHSTGEPDAAHMLESKDASRKLRQAVARLPERERQLIEAYYFEDLTLQLAGKRLGLSKSWTSRLHARAIKRLSELIDPDIAG